MLTALVGFVILLTSPYAPCQTNAPIDPAAVMERALEYGKPMVMCGSCPPPRDGLGSLAMVLSGGHDMVPHLVDLVRKGEPDWVVRLAVNAIGFLANDQNLDAVEALKTPDDARFLDLTAIPLLRIGGSAARYALDRIEHLDLTPDVFAYLHGIIWTLPRLEDLCTALAVFERMSRNHPTNFIRVQAREQAMGKVLAAIQIRSESHSKETRRLLLDIVTGHTSAFGDVHGWFAQAWALDKIVEYRVPEAIDVLQKFVRESHCYGSDGIEKHCVQALKQLGANLTPEEAALVPSWPEIHRLPLLTGMLDVTAEQVVTSRKALLEKN
ncbi:MAG: hypothetical protein HYR85_23870 [Planctomycetes bacterium]|nr:hypothetical protein [Planctomycetota bacterium]